MSELKKYSILLISVLALSLSACSNDKDPKAKPGSDDGAGKKNLSGSIIQVGSATQTEDLASLGVVFLETDEGITVQMEDASRTKEMDSPALLTDLDQLLKARSALKRLDTKDPEVKKAANAAVKGMSNRIEMLKMFTESMFGREHDEADDEHEHEHLS